VFVRDARSVSPLFSRLTGSCSLDIHKLGEYNFRAHRSDVYRTLLSRGRSSLSRSTVSCQGLSFHYVRPGIRIAATDVLVAITIQERSDIVLLSSSLSAHAHTLCNVDRRESRYKFDGVGGEDLIVRGAVR